MANATLILPRWIVPIDPAGVVLEHSAVVLRDARIEAVLPAEDARARYADAQVIELAEHALMPGLVNAHTHAAMTLMRGLADDLPLMRWLNEHIWPVEMRHVTPEFVRDGTLLACAEMLRGGITCFNDMYFYPEAALEAAATAGMRAALGMIVVDFPTAYASDADDYLQKGLALRDRHRDDPLASFCLAPHAPYTVSDETLHKVAMLAGELDVPVHIHVHETEDEVARSVTEHGVRPLERLRRQGLLGPNFMAVHAVHLTDDDILLLLRHNASVVHCPSSNLKLASGFAPIARLAAEGINLALGTDGAASNNRLDVLGEMRLAALLGKAVAQNAEAIPAHSALRAATLGGATALGLEPRIGSIVPGKDADLTAVRLSGPELSPCYDPVSHLVYAAGREHVTHVWVRGAPVLEAGKLKDSLITGLDSRCELWQNFIKPGPGR
ncbi:MAG: N-ethylammeline chlorohydrolase [Betaproteobacteria bacterium SG8_39]|nr:MAG: N-ethylammeline chlorohydrolase [Betaproteobacteria bacterium SG8_39]